MEWTELQQTWQEGPDVPVPDLDKLIRGRTRWIWALTAMDGLATLFLGYFLYRMLSNSPGTGEWIFVIAVVILTAMGWWATLRIRRGTWRATSRAPLAMLDLLIRRCRASITLARMNLWALGLGISFALVFRFWLKPYVNLPQFDLDGEMRGALRAVLLLVVVFWAAAAEWYRRRKTAELGRLLAVREDLSEDG